MLLKGVLWSEAKPHLKGVCLIRSEFTSVGKLSARHEAYTIYVQSVR